MQTVSGSCSHSSKVVGAMHVQRLRLPECVTEAFHSQSSQKSVSLCQAENLYTYYNMQCHCLCPLQTVTSGKPQIRKSIRNGCYFHSHTDKKVCTMQVDARIC